MTTLQTWLYYQRFPKDPIFLRFIVSLMLPPANLNSIKSKTQSLICCIPVFFDGILGCRCMVMLLLTSDPS